MRRTLDQHRSQPSKTLHAAQPVRHDATPCESHCQADLCAQGKLLSRRQHSIEFPPRPEQAMLRHAPVTTQLATDDSSTSAVLLC
jgi:hypothetical protein